MLAALIGGAVGLAVNLFQPRLYESATTLYVSSPNLSDYQSVLGAQQAAKAFVLFPQSDGMLQTALKTVGTHNLSLSQLSSMVTVDNSLNSQFVVIRVRNSDPTLAAQFASVIAKQSIELYMASQNGFRVTVLQQAEIPSSPVGQGPAIVLAIGMLVGLVVIVCVILFFEQTNGILVIRPGDQITVLDLETGLPTVITVKDLPTKEMPEQDATVKLSRISVPKLGAPFIPETPTEDAAHNGLHTQDQVKSTSELSES
jgi:capsular polysaccharide biosynthesis protein